MPQSTSPLLRGVLRAILQPYLQKHDVAARAFSLIRQLNAGGPIHLDHFAFRTFGLNGFGIDSLSRVFLDFGYVKRDELRFASKKLTAYWFAPPNEDTFDPEGDEVDGPLPRVFISEINVNELSKEAQTVIGKYTSEAGPSAASHAALSSVAGCLPWSLPSLADFKLLARESEYAAWTLVNGYALNHATVAVHRLQEEDLRDLNKVNFHLQESGLVLNSEGGIVKVSPDGGLLQSSTMASCIPFSFREKETIHVPGSYVEFAQREVLPEFAHLQPHEVREEHRRDGFEVANADKIFESTYDIAGKRS
eukprot:TRINITY_DN3079_c0_g1_i1.p1 TRINITY_DN3079_c0_g1~~TRINITY_DN3079_c0_g1_i1.p1  ORF type:complete len:307 (+),score=41.04 TRINITY_DN3079_c0_g1_i1:361-1281(+)